MAQAPQVQSLEQIMTELNPAFQGSSDVIKQQQAGLGEKYTAQQAGLDATKAQSMNTINTQATGRGMSFSGIPLDEQATYLGTQYLPAVANLKASQNNENTAFQQQLADLNSKKFMSAYDTRNNQQSAQNQWNLTQMQQEFNAAEAAKSRAFSASQAAAERDARAKEETLSPFEAAQAIATQYTMAGGEMTPQLFQLMRNSYAAAGGDKGQFASDFWNLVPKEANANSNDNDSTGWKAYYYGA